MILLLTLTWSLFTHAPAQTASSAMTIADGTRVEILHQAGIVRVRVGAARSLAYAASLPVVLETTAGVVQIRPADPKSVAVSELTVTVPPGTNLSVNGWYPGVDVSGPVGAVAINTREGAVTVTGGAAGASIRTVNGDVSITDTRGAVTVDSTAGDVTLSGLSGDVHVKGTSGKVTVRGARMPTLEVSMFSSDIAFEGRLDPAGRYALSSHTGDVTMIVPGDASATVTFLTLHGVARVTPQLEGRETSGGTTQLKRRVYRVGGGAAGVEVRTFSGNLDLRWQGARD